MSQSDRTYPGARVPADVAQRFLAELGELPTEAQAKAFDEFEGLYVRAHHPRSERDEFTRANLQLWWDGLVSVRWVAGRGLVFTITTEGIRRLEEGSP
jgi:hypothetical protein